MYTGASNTCLGTTVLDYILKDESREMAYLQDTLLWDTIL